MCVHQDLDLTNIPPNTVSDWISVLDLDDSGELHLDEFKVSENNISERAQKTLWVSQKQYCCIMASWDLNYIYRDLTCVFSSVYSATQLERGVVTLS